LSYELCQKTGAELALAFAGIPVNVTSLNLSGNGLGQKTGAELAQAFAAIPAGVTSLELSNNGLGQKTGAELAQAFAGIPVNVTSLNLSANSLDCLSTRDLLIALNGIPKTVREINLNRNKLFFLHSTNDRDALLTALREGVPSTLTECAISPIPQASLRLNIRGNGDTDIGRGLLPLFTLFNARQIPDDLFPLILSFLSGGSLFPNRLYSLWEATNTLYSEGKRKDKKELFEDKNKLLLTSAEQFSGPGVSQASGMSSSEEPSGLVGASQGDAYFFKILSMQEVQLATIILGCIIFFASSNVAIMGLGAGLALLGATSFAMNAYRTSCKDPAESQGFSTF